MPTLKKILSWLVAWGMAPTWASAQQKHYRFVSHGLLYGLALLTLALPIVAGIFTIMDHLEPGKYGAYKSPIYLHFLAYLSTIGLVFFLRGYFKWHSVPVAIGVLASCFIGTSFTLLVGPSAAFVELQVALLPLGFIWFFRSPWLGAGFALLNGLSSGVMALLSQTYLAPFPLPGYITEYLAPSMRILAGGLFFTELAYLFAVSDLPETVRDIWNRFSRVGVIADSTDEERRNHIISNQIIMSFVMIMVLFDFSALAFCIALAVLAGSGQLIGLALYFLPAVGYTSFLIWCFRKKNVTQDHELYESVAYFAGLIFVGYQAVLQDNRLGLQYLFLPVSLVPLFFSRGRVWYRAIAIVCGLALFAARYHMKSAGLAPVPETMTTIGSRFVPYLSLISVAVVAIYLWIKADLTDRFRRAWLNWSAMGTELFTSPFDQKYRRIQNQLLLMFTGIVIAAISVGSVYLFFGWRAGIDIVPYFLHYFPPIIFQTGMHVFALWQNGRTTSILPVASCFATGIPLIAWVGISLQEEILIHFFNLTLLPLPYIGFSRKYRLNRFLVMLASLSILGAVMAAHTFHLHYQPLKPLPLDWMVTLAAYIVPAALVFTFSAYFRYIWNLNSVTETQIDVERKKSDDLLRNILPENVAHELRESGKTSPILFNSASVMFTDFVGFTKIAEQLSPQDLIDELDKCFSYFDAVCDRYKLEKLKTIGDAFMAAGGIPVPNNTHAIDCCLAALEIQAFMNQMKEIKAMQEHPYWELRLGINTGNLVAGVVGEKKFAYDVWGDTVNTASRMESSGLVGKINISAATYEQVKYLFQCTHRGRVKAKNKGEIDMYLLEGIKPKYSVNGEGRVPNDRFREIYEKIEGGGRFVPKAPALQE